MPALALEDARIESCDLQLGDTWRGMQGKMSVTTPVKKIRKKSDSKPQSQINKCHNEKRRRELENETINQLEELLGTCLAEVKQPDKNGIVREATRQIEEVLKRRGECPGECPARNAQCLSPVQAGEVSSTQPPACLHYTEITTLIEALKHYTGSLGWVLLEINSKGEIECVTENIKELVLQDRAELYKKSIFSLLHINDQAKLKPLLRVIQSFAWGSGEIDKFQAIQARLLVKNTDGTEGTGYVEAVIHAAPVRGSSSEEAGSVMCVIRRREDASAALLPLDGGPPAIAAKQSDHIVFRLDCNYVILSCDLRGVENIINCPVSLVGTRYLELVESCDRVFVVAHLQQTGQYAAPPSVSPPFRIRLGASLPALRVSARSRLFRAQPSSGEPDFIMSTHTLLGDDELDFENAETPRPPVGGPLMTSVANGESSNCDRYRSPMSPGGEFLNDFDLDPWGSSFQLGEMSGDDSKDRKDASVEPPATPQTPRAQPTPGEGPTSVAPVEEPNRLRTLLSKKPVPTDAALNSNNRILKDLLKQEDEEATGSETSAPHTPLTPHTPHTPHTPAAAMSPLHSRPSPHPAHPAHPAGPAHATHAMPSHNSEVLLRILNDKSDEDGEDRRQLDGRNTSQPCALLSQLLSSSNGPSGNGRNQDTSDSYLERIGAVKRKLEEKGAAANAKRATPENQQQVSSSAVPPASSAAPSPAAAPATTSSAGMSQLCQKNQILVSLLARQQTTPTTPLPLPNPNLRAYGPAPRPRAPPPAQMPQQRHHHSTLSNILTGPAHRASNVNGGAGSGAGSPALGSELAQSHLQMVLQGRGVYPPHSAPHAATTQHYANTAAQHYNQPGSSSRAVGGAGGGAGDSEVPSDQTLSDILDEVIDHMPDADRPAPSVSVLIDLETRRDYVGKAKNDVINAITKSLMQCETVTKGPVSSSPGPPPVYAVQSPASCNMGSMGSSGGIHYVRPDGARARQLEEQHARLMHLQQRQQMLVSREADQPQADLGSTISALSETPPNVALTRTDYHHIYHPANQMGSNYGTNKITSSQQNPMLSRQLSGSGVGYAPHSAAALHTPLSAPPPPPQPYLRAPRPHLVGGYYEDGAGAGYCGDYARRAPHHHPHAPMPHPHHDPPMPCAGNGSGTGSAGSGAGAGAGASTSEYVRNELRAVVGARLHPPLQSDLDPLMTFDMTSSEYYGGGHGGGGHGGGR